jgi:hypothetical protein
MSLWGNKDYATGNNKPLYSNTSTTYGVSVTEAANTSNDGPRVVHTGWVKQTIGTGFIKTVSINNAGRGVNAAGYLTISGGGGSNANISYAIANSQNTLQSFSSNAYWNVITSLTINNPGDGYTSNPTIIYSGTVLTQPNITFEMGGRIGRRSYETIVAMGSITEDNPSDNVYFVGI